MAEEIPKIIPRKIAIEIENSAKIAVFGRVYKITSDTFFPFFWKDSLK